ncbi:hypothetical protein RJ55_02721 [Drechmeria coniospora]|nr:hypothetical protein RJ55_02721 [Drechmeria coniospora]
MCSLQYAPTCSVQQRTIHTCVCVRYILVFPLLLRIPAFRRVHIIQSPIEEAELAGNRLAAFHPTRPGHVLDGRFKVVLKLGFGISSTVWLAENLQHNKSPMPRYVTIKIPALDIDVSRETRYSKLINHANPTHEGLSFLRVPIDEFKLKAATGTHFCLVYEPMRETLFQLQHRLKRQRLALPLFKFFYLLPPSSLGLFAYRMPSYTYRYQRRQCYDNDRERQGALMAEKFTSRGATLGRSEARNCYLNWPTLISATLVWEIAGISHQSNPIAIGPRKCFSGAHGHIALTSGTWALLCGISWKMPIYSNALLAKMATQERLMRDHQLKEPVTNSRGERYYNMNQYWGGPFFDDHGKIFRQDLIDEERSLADTVTEIGGDEKETFLDFASCMLQWIPDERKTAKELLKHPFFDSFYEERMNDKSG